MELVAPEGYTTVPELIFEILLHIMVIAYHYLKYGKNIMNFRNILHICHECWHVMTQYVSDTYCVLYTQYGHKIFMFHFASEGK